PSDEEGSASWCSHWVVAMLRMIIIVIYIRKHFTATLELHRQAAKKRGERKGGRSPPKYALARPLPGGSPWAQPAGAALAAGGLEQDAAVVHKEGREHQTEDGRQLDEDVQRRAGGVLER